MKSLGICSGLPVNIPLVLELSYKFLFAWRFQNQSVLCALIKSPVCGYSENQKATFTQFGLSQPFGYALCHFMNDMQGYKDNVLLERFIN